MITSKLEIGRNNLPSKLLMEHLPGPNKRRRKNKKKMETRMETNHKKSHPENSIKLRKNPKISTLS